MKKGKTTDKTQFRISGSGLFTDGFNLDEDFLGLVRVVGVGVIVIGACL